MQRKAWGEGEVRKGEKDFLLAEKKVEPSEEKDPHFQRRKKKGGARGKVVRGFE